MKICPKCGRKYEEENAKYCVNEGATLKAFKEETSTVSETSLTNETVPEVKTVISEEKVATIETIPPAATALSEGKVPKSETVPKKKSNNVLIIVIVAVLLLCGLAFGAMKYFNIDKEQIMNFLGIEQTVTENKQEDDISETRTTQEEVSQIEVSQIEESESQIENDESPISPIENEPEQLEDYYDLSAEMIDSLQKVIEEKQKEITGLKDKIKKQDREITELKDKINKLEKEVVELKAKIKKLKAPDPQLEIFKTSQRNLWYSIGTDLFQVYNGYKDIKGKDKTNDRQIKEKDRKLLQKAKLCFQEAAKLGHTGTKTQIEKIDTELSKL